MDTGDSGGFKFAMTVDNLLVRTSQRWPRTGARKKAKKTIESNEGLEFTNESRFTLSWWSPRTSVRPTAAWAAKGRAKLAP